MRLWTICRKLHAAAAFSAEGLRLYCGRRAAIVAAKAFERGSQIATFTKRRLAEVRGLKVIEPR
jgi:predicted nucleic acid-binding protein